MVGFFATLYFARVLGAGTLGTYFVVIALVVWLKIPMNAVGAALTKRVSEMRAPGSFLTAGGGLYAGLTVVMVLVTLVFAGAVDAHVGAPVATLIAALLAGNASFSFVTASLNGQKKVATSKVLIALNKFFEAGAQIGLVVLGYGVAGLIGGNIVALVVAALIGLALFGVRPTVPKREHVRSLLEYARYSWLGTVSGRTFGWMDTLVLSFFVGHTLIGAYEVSWRLASVLVLLSNSIQHTLFPEISDLATDGETEKIRFFLDEALFYAGLFAIPGLFGAIVLGPRVLRIYGPEFRVGSAVLAILVFARLIDGYGSQLMSVINGIDRPDIAFRINGAFMVSNLVLNVGLIALFGWVGAAVATAVSGGLMAVLSFIAVRRLVGDFALPVGGVARQVLASLVMAAAVVLLREVVPIQNMYQSVAYIFLGAAVYGVVLFALSRRVRSKVVSMLPRRFTGTP